MFAKHPGDRKRAIPIPAAAICFLVFLNFASPTLGGEIRVDYAAGLLSVKAEAATQQQILDEINRKTGGKLVVEKEIASRSVSLTFQKLPLLQGVRRILPHASHVVLYDRSGAVEAIFIMADGKIAPAVQKGTASGANAPRAGERQEILANVPEPPAAPDPGVGAIRPSAPQPAAAMESSDKGEEAFSAEMPIPQMPVPGSELPVPGGAFPAKPTSRPTAPPGMPVIPAPPDN